MENIVLVLIAVSLIFTASANRLQSFLRLLFFQGILLFAASALRLSHSEPLGFLLILGETLFIKAIFVPLVLSRVVRKSRSASEADATVSRFSSVLGATLILVSSFLLSYSLHDKHVSVNYFAVSLSAIFVGILLIISRRRLFTHIAGYVVIENGVYLLSLAVGTEMPLAVGTAMLLDLFTGVLIFGLFLNRLGAIYKDLSGEELTELRD